MAMNTQMKTLPFTKMQSLGNDFVVLDGVQHAIQLTPELIRNMADRHRGVGFDQLLLIEPVAAGIAADFIYRIFNADGSEVSQCGNGARCVGRFLREEGLIPPEKTEVLLSTKERILEVHFREDDQIAVNMGTPVFEPQKIPFQAPAIGLRYVITIDSEAIEVGVVSMGNPHVVIQVEDIGAAPIAVLGPKLESHARFPERVNVGFMEYMSRNRIKLRVYERGAGETLACGSGACAAMVIGQVQGLLDTAVDVDLPGGTLHISWLGENHPVWMVGPASIVFKGEWVLAVK